MPYKEIKSSTDNTDLAKNAIKLTVDKTVDLRITYATQTNLAVKNNSINKTNEAKENVLKLKECLVKQADNIGSLGEKFAFVDRELSAISQGL